MRYDKTNYRIVSVKYVLVSFFITCYSVINAQDALVYFNLNMQQIGSKSFKAFSNSYQLVNAAQLKSANINQPGLGFTIGGTIKAQYGDGFLGLEYSRSKSKAEFNFLDGGKRKFSLHSNLITFKFSMPIGDVEENSLFGLVDFGAGIGRAVINSSFEQGSVSQNSMLLDGKYTGFHGEVSGGLSLVYSIGIVGIKASASYNLSAFGIRLDDKDKEMDYDSLPQDFGAYSSDPSTYLGEEVKDDFRYFKFGLGVVVVL